MGGGAGAEVDAAALQSGQRRPCTPTRAPTHALELAKHANFISRSCRRVRRADWVFGGGGRFNHGDTHRGPAARQRPSLDARRDEHSEQ